MSKTKKEQPAEEIMVTEADEKAAIAAMEELDYAKKFMEDHLLHATSEIQKAGEWIHGKWCTNVPGFLTEFFDFTKKQGEKYLKEIDANHEDLIKKLRIVRETYQMATAEKILCEVFLRDQTYAMFTDLRTQKGKCEYFDRLTRVYKSLYADI